MKANTSAPAIWDTGMRMDMWILVDRKANMIISGGGRGTSSRQKWRTALVEIQRLKMWQLSGYPMRNGANRIAVIVLHEGQTATPEEITAFCKGKIAGFKVPKNIIFIKDEEMPRSGAGKILHRMLREQFGKWADHQ